MGGSEALYITQAYFNKYNDFFKYLNTSFDEKMDIIIKMHGVINKPFADFGNNKYPRYFIDAFSGI
jgi:hypothetical protein